MEGTIVFLLGPVHIAGSGTAGRTRFRSRRTKLLLGYLILARRPIARRALAALFWPDHSTREARANLRRELHNLKRLLPRCWAKTSEMVSFIPRKDLLVDVLEMERLVEAGEWSAAAAWLRGELLEGLSMEDRPEVDQWLQGERERCRHLAEKSLFHAARHLWHAGSNYEAERWLMRLLQLSPWHEEGHRALMRLLARRKRYRAAMRQFRRCEEALQRELGVSPASETHLLYQRIARRQRVAAR